MIDLFEGDRTAIGNLLSDAARNEYSAADTKDVFMIFSMLRPSVSIDGNQWCILYGSDLQTGIAGFGDTIWKAVIDFNGAFHRNPGTK